MKNLLDKFMQMDIQTMTSDELKNNLNDLIETIKTNNLIVKPKYKIGDILIDLDSPIFKIYKITSLDNEWFGTSYGCEELAVNFSNDISYIDTIRKFEIGNFILVPIERWNHAYKTYKTYLVDRKKLSKNAAEKIKNYKI